MLCAASASESKEVRGEHAGVSGCRGSDRKEHVHTCQVGWEGSAGNPELFKEPREDTGTTPGGAPSSVPGPRDADFRMSLPAQGSECFRESLLFACIDGTLNCACGCGRSPAPVS